MPEVTRTNPDALKVMSEKLDALDGYTISAGWDKSAVYENGQPVAQVMAWQEFGVAGRIPARPFMRPAIAEDKSKWDASIMELSKQYLNGKSDADTVFDTFGLMMEGSIVDAISRVTAPVLSPVTLLLRKWKKQGVEISGKVVGAAARIVEEGHEGGFYSYEGSFAGVSTKPLNDTGYAISTVTHVVDRT